MDEKGKNKKVEEMVETSLQNLNELVNANSVVGKPIITGNGFKLIPISKVTMGYLSGGGEYGEVKVLNDIENYPFAGGSGAVVSLKPTGFILDTGNDCKFIHVGDAPIDNLVDKASEFMDKFINKNV